MDTNVNESLNTINEEASQAEKPMGMSTSMEASQQDPATAENVSEQDVVAEVESVEDVVAEVDEETTDTTTEASKPTDGESVGDVVNQVEIADAPTPEGVEQSEEAGAAEGTSTEEEHPMNALLENMEFRRFRRGDVVEGRILEKSDNEIVVDVNMKSEGIVPTREFDRVDKTYLDSLEVGSKVITVVVTPEDSEGNLILSLNRAQREREWHEAEKLKSNQTMIEATISGYNRGGVLVRIGRLRGFVPASQLASERHKVETSEEDPEKRWMHLMGKTIPLKVLEIDHDRNRLILSERAAMREWRKKRGQELLAQIKEGDIVAGRVTSITDFGAFVDIGGVDGLIHISEMSWGRVKHAKDVLKVGQEVEVYVLKVDRKHKRIGLSLRRLQPEPWSQVSENLAIGQVVDGVITKLTNFGAFSEILPGVEGLIHISEMADYHVNHPKEVVRPGQKVRVRILRIDTDEKRIGLSLKQAEEKEYIDLDWDVAGSEEEEEETTSMADAFQEATSTVITEDEVAAPIEDSEVAGSEGGAKTSETEVETGESETNAPETNAPEASAPEASAPETSEGEALPA